MGCFSGPTTTTTNNQQQQQQQQSQSTGSTNANQTSTATSTPNLPSWFMNLKQGAGQGLQNLAGQYGAMASQNLYGPLQQAAYQQQLRQAMGAAQQNATSQLAKSGALDSGRAAQVGTGIQLAGMQNLQNYLAQVPMLNAQNRQQAMAGQGNAYAQMGNLSIPYGTTQTGNQSSTGNTSQNMTGSSNGTMSGTQTQQTSGGMLQGLLGGLLNSGLSALTGGLSGLFTGGGGQGSAQPSQTAPLWNYAPIPGYGASEGTTAPLYPYGGF